MVRIESAEPLSPEQQDLWDRVRELWRCLQAKDMAAIEAAIHPRYTGWVAGSPLPHGRDLALKAAETDPRITGYRLYPLRVEVYDGVVGVAHYSFEAEVSLPKGKVEKEQGRWTEVYLRKDRAWLMISVHGGPE